MAAYRTKEAMNQPAVVCVESSVLGVCALWKDVEQWDKLSSAIGGSCSLLSDVTSKPQTPPLPGVKGHILRQMNETSISDLIRITSDYQGNRTTGGGRDEFLPFSIFY